jgi:TonB family protein
MLRKDYITPLLILLFTITGLASCTTLKERRAAEDAWLKKITSAQVKEESYVDLMGLGLARYRYKLPKVNEEETEHKFHLSNTARNAPAGVLTVRLWIDKNGKVTKAKVIKPLSPELDRNFLLYRTRAKYHPGKVDGKPVNTIMTLRFSFFKSRPNRFR